MPFYRRKIFLSFFFIFSPAQKINNVAVDGRDDGSIHKTIRFHQAAQKSSPLSLSTASWNMYLDIISIKEDDAGECSTSARIAAAAAAPQTTTTLLSSDQ